MRGSLDAGRGRRGGCTGSGVARRNNRLWIKSWIIWDRS